MTMSLREVLDRTLLLMRDELVGSVSDATLLAALTSTEIALVADGANISSHSAQCAFVTAALLLARSGHRVHLVAPNTLLLGAQPPLKHGNLLTSLVDAGEDLLPGVSFAVGLPAGPVDLAIVFGNTRCAAPARQVVCLNADAWRAWLCPPRKASLWRSCAWPFGGMAGGALASGEAFKVSMRKLAEYARVPDLFRQYFAPATEAELELAPPSTPHRSDLRNFDLVSGGAITNAVLYALARIPKVIGTGRVIEADESALSNLNRYMLLLRSHVLSPKATHLSQMDLAGLVLSPVAQLYLPESAKDFEPLAPAVLVGVDHVPTRWEVQKACPQWLGIGATSHWSAMASFHGKDLACAACLHPTDEPGAAPIPTVAFVSFWAGLLLASYFIRHVAGAKLSAHVQHVYLSPLRPETVWQSPVAIRANCRLHPVVDHGEVELTR